MQETQIVHVVNGESEPLVASAQRKGGRMAAECECGWYCLHNHKSLEAAANCIKEHASLIED